VKRPHKYKAVATEVDGIRFASKSEARRYQELRLLEKAGEIYALRLQPVFPLVAVAEQDGERKGVGQYRGDFCYCQKGSAALVVEDVKGFKTPLYRWKKKHVEAQYGIEIREVR
jgi:hypothetical protein